MESTRVKRKASDNVKRHASMPQNASAMINDGRIALPGIKHTGLSSVEYQPVVKLYDNIREAREFLIPHFDKLRGETVERTGSPDWVTALDASKTIPNLYYKREDKTSTRAYKVRGAVVSMSHAMEEHGYQKFLTVSTGNHALGVLKAAEILKPEQVRVVIPTNTPEIKLNRMKLAMDMLNEMGVKAEIVVFGSVFDESRHWAQTQDNEGEFYIDPYMDPWVVAGQGSIGLELCEQLTPILEKNPHIREIQVISPVGGGGLLTGTATGLRLSAYWQTPFRKVNLRYLGIRLLDPYGSKLGDAIRVKHIADNNRDMFSRLGIPTLELDDYQLAAGQEFIQNDIGDLVEGASAGAVYPPLTFESCHPSDYRLVVCILSGGNL